MGQSVPEETTPRLERIIGPSIFEPGMTCKQPFSAVASSKAIHTPTTVVPIGKLK